MKTALARTISTTTLAASLLSFPAAALSQTAAAPITPPVPAPAPAKIQPNLLIITDAVVTTQWPHTLNLVSPPHNLTLLNPGQCIRVGIIATGTTAADLLSQTSVSFNVQLAGHSSLHPLAPLSQLKQLKPQATASLGLPADRWCVPDNADDETATIEVATQSGSKTQSLPPATIQIQSFSTGSKLPVASEQDFDDFFTTYYRQPNPARLLPILQYAVSSDEQLPSASLLVEVAVFLSAALKADPVAANDFLSRMPAQSPNVRRLGLVSVRAAGYDIAPVLQKLPPAEQEEIGKIPPLIDPFDLSPGPQIAVHLDMLWGVFGATGDFAPVKALAGTLAWQPDYDAFLKWRDDPKHDPKPSDEITPSLIRGLAFTAAGWSMHSFQQSDPLVADYIEFMLASPDTPPLIKTELKGLDTNPAFKKGGGQ
jgi:hypothetical protein